MKRFIAFYGDTFYPTGGSDEIVGDYDSWYDAIKEIKKVHFKEKPKDEFFERAWWEIYDSHNKKILDTNRVID